MYCLCVQVREALRRSREESRDLRGSLFRAEDVIKQLTLTKAGRRRGAAHLSSSSSSNAAPRHHHGMMSRPSSSSALLSASSSSSSPSSPPAAETAASSEKNGRKASNKLASGVGSVGGGDNNSERKGSSGGTGSGSSDHRPSSGSGSRHASGGTVSAPATTVEPETNTAVVDTQQSRGDLLTRVQQLERELRLADFRNARNMRAAAVRVGHGQGRRNSLDNVRRTFIWGVGTVCIHMFMLSLSYCEELFRFRPMEWVLLFS